MSARKPGLAVPAGASDTHLHVYRADVPTAPGGPPLPGDFRESQYLEVRQRLGLSRVIVVRPIAYQDDNRVTHDAICALGPGARGVSVVKPGVADAEIERQSKVGIVAQRAYQLPGGAVSLSH